MAFIEWSDKFETGMVHLDKDHRMLFMIVNSLHDMVAVEEGHETAAGKSEFWVFERRTQDFPDLRLSKRVDLCVRKTGDCPTLTLSTAMPGVRPQAGSSAAAVGCLGAWFVTPDSVYQGYLSGKEVNLDNDRLHLFYGRANGDRMDLFICPRLALHRSHRLGLRNPGDG